jgi:predicted acylesterase/phospholipase RssA/CRP-like cAMP-binding protein
VTKEREPRLTDIEKEQALAKCLDLQGLSNEDLRRLAPRFKERTVQCGETICEEEILEGVTGAQDQRGIYCIVEGVVSVTHRSDQRRAPVVFTLGEGGLFGENWLEGGGLLGAEACRRSRLLWLDREGILWARTEPSLSLNFNKVAKRLTRIYRELPWLADQLRRSVLLRNVPPRFIYELLEGAEIAEVALNQPLLEAVADPPDGSDRAEGIFVVLSGELVMYDRKTKLPIRMLNRGDVFGDLELLTKQKLEHLIKATPEGPVKVLKIFPGRLRSLLEKSSTFRRFILNSGVKQLDLEQRVDLIATVQNSEQGAMNLSAVLGDDPSLPIPTLVDWMAEATAQEFGDKVLVIHLDPQAPEPPELGPEELRPGEVRRVRLRLHPELPQLTGEKLQRLGKVAHHVLLDVVDGGDPGPLPWPLNSVDQTVYVASRPYGSPPNLVDRLPHPLLYTAVVPTKQRLEDPLVPLATVRIHWDLVKEARERGRGASFARLPDPLKQKVRRWARAITDRRIGLALGGGGAFGFAHIPLIQQIEQAGIPIDLISGCSVGSGVGAYYAAKGLGGLGEFLKAAGNVLTNPKTLVTSRRIADFIDKRLDGVRLEDLEVPFYPVVADIETACQMTVRSGTVGQGVRASAAFPGFLTPTIMYQHAPGYGRRRFRFVDGGVINLVPDDMLYLEGAQLVLASNVIPPPRPRKQTSTKLVQWVQSKLERMQGPLWEMVTEMEPVVRLDDCLRTMYIMMHAPVDWETRPADAKFRAIPGAYSPMQWNNGKEITAAYEKEEGRKYVDRAVARLKASYDALSWQQPTADLGMED